MASLDDKLMEKRWAIVHIANHDYDSLTIYLSQIMTLLSKRKRIADTLHSHPNDMKNLEDVIESIDLINRDIKRVLMIVD